jgi:hypothetical protein
VKVTKTPDNTTVIRAPFSEQPGVRRQPVIGGSLNRFDGDTTMASIALFTKLKSVDQDDTKICQDFSRGDTETVIDKERETRQRRELRVGLWFWAIE